MPHTLTTDHQPETRAPHAMHHEWRPTQREPRTYSLSMGGRVTHQAEKQQVRTCCKGRKKPHLVATADRTHVTINPGHTCALAPQLSCAAIVCP